MNRTISCLPVWEKTCLYLTIWRDTDAVYRHHRGISYRRRLFSETRASLATTLGVTVYRALHVGGVLRSPVKCRESQLKGAGTPASEADSVTLFLTRFYEHRSRATQPEMIVSQSAVFTALMTRHGQPRTTGIFNEVYTRMNPFPKPGCTCRQCGLCVWKNRQMAPLWVYRPSITH